METVVLSLGGSVLVKDENDTSYLRKLAKILIGVSATQKLYVVVGGGKIARYYIKEGRELGADESFLDEMGIEVTRLNARLLIVALGDHAYHVPPKNYDEALHAGRTHDALFRLVLVLVSDPKTAMLMILSHHSFAKPSVGEADFHALGCAPGA